MKSQASKPISRQTIQLICLSVAILAPFLVLSFFNYPSSDDYSFHQQLIENGFWKSMEQLYLSWTGRMISFLNLFLLDPLTDRSYFYYQFLSFLIIPLFYISVLKLTQSELIFNTKSGFLSILLTAYIIYFLHDTADFFYWFIASYSYTIGLIYLLIWLIIHYQYQSKKWAIPFLLLLPILTTGTCELALILFGIASCYIILTSWQSKTVNYWTIGGIVLGVMASIIWISAPGNAVRNQAYESIYGIETHSISFAIAASFKKMALVYFDWFIKKPSVPITLLLATIIYKQGFKPKANANLIIKLLIGLLYLPLLLLFYYWATGIEFVALRILNYGFVVFCLFAIPSAAWLIQPYFKRINAYHKPIMYASIFGLILMLSIRSNLRWAVQDLIHAKAYQTEINSRIQLLEENKNQSVALPSIKHPLRTTFFAEIDSLPSHWYNKGLAWYYGVNEVKKLD